MWRTALAVALVSALGLSACGDDGGSGGDEEAGSTTTESSDTTTTTLSPEAEVEAAFWVWERADGRTGHRAEPG